MGKYAGIDYYDLPREIRQTYERFGAPLILYADRYPLKHGGYRYRVTVQGPSVYQWDLDRQTGRWTLTREVST